MPGLEEVPLFHNSSVWRDSVRVSTGQYISLIRVTQPEGWQGDPRAGQGSRSHPGERKRMLNWEGERSCGKDKGSGLS